MWGTHFTWDLIRVRSKIEHECVEKRYLQWAGATWVNVYEGRLAARANTHAIFHFPLWSMSSGVGIFISVRLLSLFLLLAPSHIITIAHNSTRTHQATAVVARAERIVLLLRRSVLLNGSLTNGKSEPINCDWFRVCANELIPAAVAAVGKKVKFHVRLSRQCSCMPPRQVNYLLASAHHTEKSSGSFQ